MSRSIVFAVCPIFAAVVLAWNSAAQAPAEPIPYKNVGPTEFEKLSKQPKHVILDVRNAAEFAMGHLKGAINIDMNAADFPEKVAKLDKELSYLVHCASGGRSVTACEKLNTLTFPRLFNLEGGIRAWTKAGMPVEK